MAILHAILAAVLYALSTPFSKQLLSFIPSMMMAALLYLGAGIGMALFSLCIKKGEEKPLTRQELPYTIAIVVLDIAAPIFLMLGLRHATAAHVALLNNFEIVATTGIAFFVFKERMGKRLIIAMALITLASFLLSMEDASSFTFSLGSAFVLLACICWGMENNCTRKLSSKNPTEIVIIKGIGSGIGALVLSYLSGERIAHIAYIPLALCLGFVSYGLSIYFYIYAQRHIGAARTSAYYAIAPFLSAGISLVFFRQAPDMAFIIALLIMSAGTAFVSVDIMRKEADQRGAEKV